MPTETNIIAQDVVLDDGTKALSRIEDQERELVGQNSHLWFCCYPAFSTQIVFYAEKRCNLSGPNEIQIYDADGLFVNSAKVSFGATRVATFELDSLISGCKLEAGLKHGHVVVNSPPGVRHQSRLLSMRDGWISNSARVINKRKDLFFPFRFAPDRSSMLALVNQSVEASEIRLRVFCGSRSPKVDIQLPAMGSRIFNIDSLFPEYGYMQEKALNAYLRIGVRGGGSSSCLLLERLLERADSDYFQAVN